MAVTKSFLKSRPVCKVKFRLTDDEAHGADAVYVVGDFNDWNDASHPMKKLKGGGFSLELELPQGQECQFRYRTSDNLWLNDTDADGYAPSPYADIENSVIKA